MLGLPLKIFSASIQASAAAAVATKVLTIASAAVPFRLECRTGVEAEPAKPTAGPAPIRLMVSELRSHRLTAPGQRALPSTSAPHQAGDAGVDVHDGAAGEVERAPLEGETGVSRDHVHRCSVRRPWRRPVAAARALAATTVGAGALPSTRPCARSGSTRNVDQSGMKITSAENFMRSASAPDDQGPG